MKNILTLVLTALALFSTAQVIQQANTYSRQREESVTLEAAKLSKILLPDTTPIKTIKIEKNPVRTEPIYIEPKAVNIKDTGVAGGVNREVGKIVYNGELVNELQYKLMNENDLEKRKRYQEEILKLKENIKDSEYVIEQYKRNNIGLTAEINKIQKQLQDSEEDKLKIIEQYFQLRKEAYGQFSQISMFRIREIKSSIQQILDTLILRSKNITDLDNSLSDIPNNKELKTVAKVLNTISNNADELKKKIESTNETTQLTETDLGKYDSYKIAMDAVLKSNNYEAFFKDYIVPAQNQINEGITSSAKKVKDLQIDLNQINTTINQWREQINAVVEKYKPKTKDKLEDYTVVGGFNKMLNERGALIPAVTLLGHREFGKPGEVGKPFGDIKLFMGGTADNLAVNTGYNFFAPSASAYGLVVNVGFGISQFSDEQKRARNLGKDEKSGGFLVSFAYLSKRLKPNDSTTIDPGVLHWKTGGEWILFPNNILSLHSNVNGMFVGAQFDKIQSHYTMQNDVNWFVDAGLTTYLKLAENDKLFLKLDLNFIFTTDKMRSFINTADKFIPQFKLDIVKNF